MGVALEVEDETGTPVMNGRATITFPAAERQCVMQRNENAAGRIRRATNCRHHEDADPGEDRPLRRRVSGDHNPLHTDPAFAATTQFGGTIAHGMLVLAYVSELMTAAFGDRLVRVRAPKGPLPRRRATRRHRHGVGRVLRVEGDKISCEVECRNQTARS